MVDLATLDLMLNAGAWLALLYCVALATRVDREDP